MPRAARLVFSTLLILAGAVIVATLAMHQAQRHSLEDDAARAQGQLSLYANTLQTLIERYRALPSPCWRWTRSCETPSKGR
jgi:two-component system C4-dicarboxylate transport sensor histidine kinase DctB